MAFLSARSLAFFRFARSPEEKWLSLTFFSGIKIQKKNLHNNENLARIFLLLLYANVHARIKQARAPLFATNSTRKTTNFIGSNQLTIFDMIIDKNHNIIRKIDQLKCYNRMEMVCFGPEQKCTQLDYYGKLNGFIHWHLKIAIGRILWLFCCAVFIVKNKIFSFCLLVLRPLPRFCWKTDLTSTHNGEYNRKKNVIVAW